jgi:enoyl-CoA hydratase/carnithine racemase
MSVRLEIQDRTAHLLIDRADMRNAFNLEMWEAIPALLEEASSNHDIKLMIVRAAGPGAFCAGADIKELLANKDDPAWRSANQSAINRAQYELTRLSLPTIAMIEGDCIGGGCGLALACDLRVAAPGARFGITPAKLGLVYPLHDVKLLIDLVGSGQAKRILFTGGLIDAAEAHRIGLVEFLDETPDALIAELLAASPHSVREIKRFVRRVLDGQTSDDADTLKVFAEAFTGDDFAEGARAFVEKRRPRFGVRAK